MNVLLKNRVATFQEPYPRGLVRSVLSYYVPGYRFMPQYRAHVWDGRIYLLRGHQAPTGVILDCLPELRKIQPVVIADSREAPTFRKQNVSGLRDYQEQCVEAMIQTSNTGGLVICATGTGKTFIAGAYFHRLNGLGCFIVDELSLMEQARAELEKVIQGPVGVIGEGVFQPKRITVATIQTLHLRLKEPAFRQWMKKLSVIILDEVHLALNDRSEKVIHAAKPKAVFGLTATLDLKSPHIRLRAVALTGPPVFEFPIREATQQGVLTEGRVFAIPIVHKPNGAKSYQEVYRRMVVLSRKRNDIVEKVVRESLKAKKQVVVLVERLLHLRILERRLEDLPHGVVCGAVPKEDRLKAKKHMDQRKLPLILASRVFAKGIDIRSVDVIVDASGMASKNNAIQRFGRGVRLAEGKKALLHFDIYDKGEPLLESAAKSRREAFVSKGLDYRRFPAVPKESMLQTILHD